MEHNSDFKCGKRAGKYFCRSIKQTSNFISDDEMKSMIKCYGDEYQKGFIAAWNDFWREPLMKIQ
tara:strand:- start:114 stop:308 length:195 start_codon:yes stop_codon:yes gene_type:complete